jgi:hypothetical protein
MCDQLAPKQRTTNVQRPAQPVLDLAYGNVTQTAAVQFQPKQKYLFVTESAHNISDKTSNPSKD